MSLRRLISLSILFFPILVEFSIRKRITSILLSSFYQPFPLFYWQIVYKIVHDSLSADKNVFAYAVVIIDHIVLQSLEIPL